MKKCVITFRSVTPAQRAEEVLRWAGVGYTIQRTPKWMEEKGCGYSLKIDCQDAMTASALLHQAGVHYRRVYAISDNGTLEDLRL